MSAYDPNVPDILHDIPHVGAMTLEEVAAVDEALTLSDELEDETLRPINPARPIVPITPTRYVSGRYRSCGGNWELVLRVDVDGNRPMRRVSGDYYTVSGRTKRYFGSFRVDAITLTISSGFVRI